MSKEIVAALSRGDITPAQFWIRHISPWTLIADTTPLTEVEDTYRELADTADFLADAFSKTA